MLTDQELRQAVFALTIIEERGDPDELAYILRQVGEATPSADPWGNATVNQEISGRRLAAKLAGLLGERRDRCEQVAAEVFAPQRRRAIFDALTGYADRLTGQTSRSTSSAAPKLTHRPTIRLIANREAVA